jgi:hypothetical protein
MRHCFMQRTSVAVAMDRNPAAGRRRAHEPLVSVMRTSDAWRRPLR